jgi:acyl carrier protein
VTIVAEIPRTPTGKPRRAVLAQMLAGEDRAPQTLIARTPPATPLEELVAEIWRQVLKAEAIGVHDDFFRLGGDSILATRILSRVRQSTNVEVSFLVFQEMPTVAGMAKAIEDDRTATMRPPVRSRNSTTE